MTSPVFDPIHYLQYGALGASMLVLLVAVGMMLRVLAWARELMALVLDRVQDNTRALAVLAERLGAHEEAP